MRIFCFCLDTVQRSKWSQTGRDGVCMQVFLLMLLEVLDYLLLESLAIVDNG